MPGPSDPPNGGFTAAIFTNIRTYSFNTAGGYWTDGSGNHLYLIASSGGSVGGFAWMLDKPTNFPNNPYGPGSASLAKIIANGTRNNDGTIAYSGASYAVMLKRDSSGNNVVDAIAI